MNENPFTFGNPISDPARFIGREQELRQIASRLLTSALESTSLIGERRMGKTSLLQQFTQPAVISKLEIMPGEYCIVYIDLQGIGETMTPNRFWKRVLTKTAQTVQNQTLQNAIHTLLQQESIDIFDLDDLFETIGQENRKVILLLDEFESVTQNKNFGSDFFGGLRSLAIGKPLGLVTATQCSLVDLCHSDEIKNSPFFNIFATVILRPFNAEHAEKLVEQATAGSELHFDEGEKQLVQKMGGRHPFFLQMAGHYLYEGKLAQQTGDRLHQTLVDNFDQQASPHFGYLWEQCTANQKITLLTLIILSQKNGALEKGVPALMIDKANSSSLFELDMLKQRGLLLETDDCYSLFSPRLEAWILHELQAIPGEEIDQDSLKDWVKRGGLKDTAAASEFLRQFNFKYWPLLIDCVKQLSFGVAGNALYTMLLSNLMRSIF